MRHRIGAFSTTRPTELATFVVLACVLSATGCDNAGRTGAGDLIADVGGDAGTAGDVGASDAATVDDSGVLDDTVLRVRSGREVARLLDDTAEASVAVCWCIAARFADSPQCIEYTEVRGLGVYDSSCVGEREWELTDAEYAQLECIHDALVPDRDHQDNVGECGQFNSRFPYDSANNEAVCLDCVDYYLSRFESMCDPIVGTRLEEVFALCRVELP